MARWHKDFLLRDAVLLSTVAAGIALWGLFWHWTWVVGLLNTLRSGLYTTLAALLGGLLGFVITGVSILLTLGDGPRLSVLRQSTAFADVFHIFTSTARWLAVGMGASLVALFIDRDPRPVPTVTFLVFWAVLVSFGRLLRCMWVLEKLIKVVVRDKKEALGQSSH